MKTVTHTAIQFNTLDELFEAAQGHQVTAQEIINGRSHVLGEWQAIELSSELRDKVCRDLSNLYGGRVTTKNEVYRSLKSGRPQHWGLTRTVVEKYGDNPARMVYITGQDQSYESAEIRKHLRR